MVMPQQTVCTWGGFSGNPAAGDFYVEVKYSANGGAQITRNIKVPDIYKKPAGSFCFEPGKQYTFDLTLDVAANVIEITVNDVADWTDVSFKPQPYYVPTVVDGPNGFSIFFANPAEPNPPALSFVKMTATAWDELAAMINTWPTSYPCLPADSARMISDYINWLCVQVGAPAGQLPTFKENGRISGLYQSAANMEYVRTAILEPRLLDEMSYTSSSSYYYTDLLCTEINYNYAGAPSWLPNEASLFESLKSWSESAPAGLIVGNNTRILIRTLDEPTTSSEGYIEDSVLLVEGGGSTTQYSALSDAKTALMDVWLKISYKAQIRF
jgi:hypothetical protein